MTINTLVVCETRLTNDDKQQRETAVAVVRDAENPCTRRVVGVWMDFAHQYTCVNFEKIAISLSNDGKTWFAPAGFTAPSGCAPLSAVRRWFNDCYFVGDCPNTSQCLTLPPTDCDPELEFDINPNSI